MYSSKPTSQFNSLATTCNLHWFQSKTFSREQLVYTRVHAWISYWSSILLHRILSEMPYCKLFSSKSICNSNTAQSRNFTWLKIFSTFPNGKNEMCRNYPVYSHSMQKVALLKLFGKYLRSFVWCKFGTGGRKFCEAMHENTRLVQPIPHSRVTYMKSVALSVRGDLSVSDLFVNSNLLCLFLKCRNSGSVCNTANTRKINCCQFLGNWKFWCPFLHFMFSPMTASHTCW